MNVAMQYRDHIASRQADPQHNFSYLFSSQQPLVRSDRLVQRKHSVDDRFDAMFSDKAQHGGKFFR